MVKSQQIIYSRLKTVNTDMDIPTRIILKYLLLNYQQV